MPERIKYIFLKPSVFFKALRSESLSFLGVQLSLACSPLVTTGHPEQKGHLLHMAASNSASMLPLVALQFTYQLIGKYMNRIQPLFFQRDVGAFEYLVSGRGKNI
jgi:hypothetical protein